jgi:hypothetical protein
MKLFKHALLALAALCLVGSPAFAADNVAVTPGTGKTMACKDIATVCQAIHEVADSTGAIIDPMTKTGGTVGLVAGSAIAGKFGIDQTTPGTTDSVTPKATEAHLGEVGGNVANVQTTPTTTAVAFTTGWSVGGLQTIASAARVSGGTGLLQDVVVSIKTNQTATYDIFLFNDTTLSSTCTNAAAFVYSSADFAKLVGVIHVTDITAGNTTSVAQALNLAKTYKAVATSLYACAVVRGTPTWGSTTDLTFSYTFIRN